MIFEPFDDILKEIDDAPESPDVPRRRPTFMEMFRKPADAATEPPAERQRLKFIPFTPSPYRRTRPERPPVQLFFREGARNLENNDSDAPPAAPGRSIATFSQRQAGLVAASEILKPQSTYSFDLDFSLASSPETANSAIAVNPAGVDMFNGQTAVDVALACLQMETDSGLVCSVEPPAALLNSGSVLAVSGGISTPAPFVGEGQFGRSA